jgi:hypothetical protein
LDYEVALLDARKFFLEKPGEWKHMPEASIASKAVVIFDEVSAGAVTKEDSVICID